MILYILRHGETRWNITQRLQGTLDVPLNEKGRYLADLTGQNMKDIPFTAAFSSRLKRTCETAGLILQYNRCFLENSPAFLAELPEEKKEGLAMDHGCGILRDARLNEMALGSWEGMRAETLPGRGLKDYWIDRTAAGFPEGMECANDLLVRAKDFLGDITERPELKERTVLAVTHGGFLRALLEVLGAGPELSRSLFMNCEAVRVEFDPAGRVVSMERKLFYDPALAFKGETY